MSWSDASLLLVVILFCIYGVLSAIECGRALTRVLPHHLTGGKAPHEIHNLFNSLWELTNGFLIVGLISFIVLFRGAISTLSHALLAALVIALITLVIRASIVLSLSYPHPKPAKPVYNWLVLICTCITPLSFSVIAIYFITGQYFWRNSSGIVLMASAVVGLMAMGVSSITRHITPRITLLTTLLLALWGLLIGYVEPTILNYGHSSLVSPALALLTLTTALVMLGYVLSLYVLKQIHQAWQFTILLGVATPLFLAWANRPYLINGQLTIAEAYSGRVFAPIFVGGVLVVAPLAVFGYFVLTKFSYATQVHHQRLKHKLSIKK